MTAIIWAVLAFFSTLAGGLFTLKFKSKLHFIMGFAAGVLLGVVSFDILPEIIQMIEEQGIDPVKPMVALVFGFLLFHIFEKLISVHHGHEHEYAAHTHAHVGVASALALAGHSFMDGISIGIGFRINPAIGAMVALAVISHDFTDGINTVTLMLRHDNTPFKSKIFLFLDAVAPILGAITTLFFVPSESFLTLYLGFFAGFLLYIGASDILPEAHSEHSSLKTVGLTVLGAFLIFLATRAL